MLGHLQRVGIGVVEWQRPYWAVKLAVVGKRDKDDLLIGPQVWVDSTLIHRSERRHLNANTDGPERGECTSQTLRLLLQSLAKSVWSASEKAWQHTDALIRGVATLSL
jgi:hypothetical protein